MPRLLVSDPSDLYGPIQLPAWALRVAGVDEAGRGPLAGPVVAGAVVLDPQRPIPGIRDSKALSAVRREQLAAEITVHALAWGVGACSPAEIDTLNILQASLRAMARAIEDLGFRPDHVLVDGNRYPPLSCAATAVVKGDQRVPVIGAASILAKVSRDRIMLEWDRRYPDYGFARHKGYPTRAHIMALHRYGPCAIHRRSFAPVRAVLAPADRSRPTGAGGS